VDPSDGRYEQRVYRNSRTVGVFTGDVEQEARLLLDLLDESGAVSSYCAVLIGARWRIRTGIDDPLFRGYEM
jgi:hypothetical protein